MARCRCGDMDGSDSHSHQRRLTSSDRPGLRGAMSEILQEVDKGLIPSVADLETQLGDTTGAVERTYEEEQDVARLACKRDEGCSAGLPRARW